VIRDVAATTAGQTQPPAHWRRRIGDRAALLGPAFVAAIAYVDPGNVAANLQAGSRYGYLLVWVLVVAIAAAGIVQFLSAKLGLATGKSLPDLVGERLGRKSRLAYWVQAEGVAMATDLAEVIGGAIALYLLFDLPLLLGGVISGVVSLFLLSWAYARAEASYLAPTEFTAFLWASLFGYLAFGEHVGFTTVAGAVLIITGCVIAARSSPEPPAEREVVP